QRFDGTLRVFHQGRCLATAADSHTGPLRLHSFTAPPRPLPTPKPARPQRPLRSTPWKPAPSHPWKATWKQTG
ncbi:MAG TPA: hypothetical protein VNH38_00640, partial [Candidatus Dormibacteraeota bacterium]|nr:hypothetical protein [Candidatus Dormibacteraeota bacterium]